MKQERRPLEAGIDFFTCTTDNPVVRNRMGTLASLEVDRATANAERPKEARVHDYVGYRTKRCSLSENSSGKALFTLVGSACMDHWQEIITWPGVSLTRLDLAVTIEIDEPRELAKLAYNEVISHNHNLTDLKRRATIWNGSDGGATCYVGKRGTERFGRLYDKGVQSGICETGKLWRYEVELRRAAATHTWNEFKANACSFDYVAASVWDFFRSRGVSPAFERGSKTVILRREVVASSVDTKLKWLCTSVAPVVSSLLLAGLAREVYDALSLPKSWRESLESRENRER